MRPIAGASRLSFRRGALDFAHAVSRYVDGLAQRFILGSILEVSDCFFACQVRLVPCLFGKQRGGVEKECECRDEDRALRFSSKIESHSFSIRF